MQGGLVSRIGGTVDKAQQVPRIEIAEPGHLIREAHGRAEI